MAKAAAHAACCLVALGPHESSLWNCTTMAVFLVIVRQPEPNIAGEISLFRTHIILTTERRQVSLLAPRRLGLGFRLVVEKMTCRNSDTLPKLQLIGNKMSWFLHSILEICCSHDSLKHTACNCSCVHVILHKHGKLEIPCAARGKQRGGH